MLLGAGLRRMKVFLEILNDALAWISVNPKKGMVVADTVDALDQAQLRSGIG